MAWYEIKIHESKLIFFIFKTVFPSMIKEIISKITKPKKPTLALSKLVSKFFNCLEYTWAKPKNNAIKLAKNKPTKLLPSCGSKNIIIIPIKAAKIKNHFFVLIFSPSIDALARIPKGIANCEPTIIGDIIVE